jgi:hypothetical protein
MAPRFFLFLWCTNAALAQSTISPSEKSVFAGNAGWIDLRPSQAAGVQVTETFLSGKAYAANFGWLDFGDGTPANGHRYSDQSAGDFGVNLEASGALSGHAYSANTGWVVFEQLYGKPKLDFQTGKITGHAYSGNLGWIALDTAFSDLFTQSISRPDIDEDGIADAWEMLHFHNLTNATLLSDTDGDFQTDLAEFQAGTDPHSAESRFRIVNQSYVWGSNLVSLTFTSEPNRLYRIEHSNNLAGTWQNSPLGTFAPDVGPATTRTIPFPLSLSRFFRASAQLPLPP